MQEQVRVESNACRAKRHVPVQGKKVFALEKRGPCEPGYSQREVRASQVPSSFGGKAL